MRAALVLGVLVLGMLAGSACSSFGDAPMESSAADAATNGDAVRDNAPDGSPGAGADADATIDPSLIAHWTMDEAGGNVVKESVAGRDGLVAGEGKFVAGKVGNAFSTEGGVAYVIVANTSGLAVANQFSVAMWIRLYSSPNDSYFYAHGEQFSLKLNARRPQLNVGSGFYSNVFFDVPSDEWHHIAATFDSGIAKIYVDGVDGGQAEHQDGAITPTLSSPITIGAAGGLENAALGFIDDVRVWRRVLGVDEIKALAK
jgi:hypothetical protein